MAHHKRGRPKNRRSGCLFCNMHKINGAKENQLGKTGFGKLRHSIHALQDLRDYLYGSSL